MPVLRPNISAALPWAVMLCPFRAAIDATSAITRDRPDLKPIRFFVVLRDFRGENKRISEFAGFSGDEDAFLDDEDAFLVDEDAFLVDEDAFSGDEDAFLVDEDTFLVDEDTFLVDEDAFSVDEDAFLVDEDAFLVDEDAFLVDEDAFLVDEDAFLVDEDAFLVDEDAFSGDHRWTIRVPASPRPDELVTGRNHYYDIDMSANRDAWRGEPYLRVPHSTDIRNSIPFGNDVFHLEFLKKKPAADTDADLQTEEDKADTP
ncbi:MAG: hypothetical protein FWH27_03110 [Planctomycetaceae bacterium]|nr:hypothetical protein [Planctomycetaceae bacterium]